MAELRVGETIRQQIESLEDRQARANQGHELLVEDEKPLQVKLLRTPQQSPAGGYSRAARPDRVDEEALLRVAVAQFLFGTGIGRLIVNLAAAVRVFQYPLHG